MSGSWHDRVDNVGASYGLGQPPDDGGEARAAKHVRSCMRRPLIHLRTTYYRP